MSTDRPTQGQPPPPAVKSGTVQAKSSGQARGKYTVAAVMNVGVILKDDGNMWVVHEKPFPKQIRWAEYDGDDHVITLIDADGTPHPLGVKIHPDYKPTLLMAKRLMIACVAENELKAIDLIPVTVRNIDF